MATATRTTKAGTITRTIEIGSASKYGECIATVAEVKGKSVAVSIYYLTRQASDFGVAFRVEKAGEEVARDVLLNAPGGGHTCDCEWMSYRGHIKPCRHIEMALQAIREQKL